MKRLLALAVVAVLVPVGYAQAATPPSPVEALQRQYDQGKGVRFTEQTLLVAKGRTEPVQRREGLYRFGADQIARSDISAKGLGKHPIFKPERSIRIGSVVYVQSEFYADDLPKGKTWYRGGDGRQQDAGGLLSQPVNIAELPTLRALMAKARRDRHGYQGSITFGELLEVSPTFKDNVYPLSEASTVITWRLTLTRDGLPGTLTTSYPGEALLPMWKNSTVSGKTTYSAWSSQPSIKPPPSSKVSTTTLSDKGRMSLGD